MILELAHLSIRETTYVARVDERPSILVPLDGSPQALTALPVARAFADLENAVVHLVHISDRIRPPAELLRKMGLSVSHIRRAVLHQAVGDAAEAIVRLARDQRSSCIVMCAYTARKKPSEGFGRTCRSVISAAPCAVVLVSPTRDWQPLLFRRILVPHDGTPTTAAALGPALELALRSEGELLVLHVVSPRAPLPIEPGSISVPRYLDQIQHEWPAWTHVFLRRTCCSRGFDPRLKLKLALAVGEPGVEIVRFARRRRADLTVLAWRGNLDRHAAAVKAAVRAAPCPILLLRCR